MNASLLAKVGRQILSRPARFNIEDFSTDIAGFTVAAAGLNPGEVDAYTVAQKALRVTRKQMESLCLLHLWPRRFRQHFDPEPCTRRAIAANAHLAAARVAHFARTGC